MNIYAPLQITKKGIRTEEKLEHSISKTIDMLLQTPCNSSPVDPQFGFAFNNMRFETIDESDGTITNPPDTDEWKNWKNNRKELYNLKVSGNSKNINTFAAILQEAIKKYEPRLTAVDTLLSYVREKKKIDVTVKGTIIETGKPYQYKTIINIWR